MPAAAAVVAVAAVPAGAAVTAVMSVAVTAGMAVESVVVMSALAVVAEERALALFRHGMDRDSGESKKPSKGQIENMPEGKREMSRSWLSWQNMRPEAMI